MITSLCSLYIYSIDYRVKGSFFYDITLGYAIVVSVNISCSRCYFLIVFLFSVIL